MQNYRSKLKILSFYIVIFIFSFFIFNFVNAADTTFIGQKIELQYPWASSTSPAGFVATLYQASLGVAAACALGVIVFGAVLHTINAGNVSKQSEARSYMTAGVAGLILLIAAYVILWTINPSLVNLTNPGLETINNLPATDTVSSPAATTSPVPMSAKDQDQSLARDLVAAGIGFSSKADCSISYQGGTHYYNAIGTIQELSSGGVASICNSSCNCSGRGTVDPRLLQVMKGVKGNFPGCNLVVTSITTGVHEANSLHYQGKAVDISTLQSCQQPVVDYLTQQGFHAICETGRDVVSCGQGDHIHYSTSQ